MERMCLGGNLSFGKVKQFVLTGMPKLHTLIVNGQSFVAVETLLLSSR